ncbi:hypothetical protein HUG15_00300 [Salicibibacter cibarius]|uniref:Uncharacterized protein n=1 Tax=Salicibibacter cibarius TaxID=2743000 RepID=A0A7T7CA05_9BACI|nr:hypothetical protein [Salicibibacter cibarius]QQK74209.1 hypothetical protein HUG15_00300 [Salicibibacter cibarius]
MFKFQRELGDKVTVYGRLVKTTGGDVDKVKKIVKTGKKIETVRHENEYFDEPKDGVIVGVRNYVKTLEHSPRLTGKFYEKRVCESKPKTRGKAYLVALNMRDTVKVPAELVSIDLQRQFNLSDEDMLEI